MKHTLTGLALLFVVGCGTWVGNPKKPNDGKPTNNVIVASEGDVVFQRVNLTAGTPFLSSFQVSTGASLSLEGESGDNLELAIFKPDGTEAQYLRRSSANAKIEFTPSEAGEYIVSLKNNGATSEILATEQVGAEVSETVLANDSAIATHKQYALKAVVVLSRTCKTNNAQGTTDEYRAPAGQYYVQPFVFLGKVESDKKVSRISDATIQIKAGSSSMTLKRLNDFDVSVFRELSNLSKDEHIEYTRTFYQGYFGAAGEMYTTDTFRTGGDCSKTPTFAFDTDVGKTNFVLTVDATSTSPEIHETIKLRATVSPSFTMYESNGSKLTDYSLCTYDTLTGKPKVYSGSATECKKFSLSSPPYVTLDYLLPSKVAGTSTSELSDPTRILFYGHSRPAAWHKALIDNSSALIAGTKTGITLSSCLNNGGLNAVPLTTDKTYMPLSEFHAAEDDVIALARRAGSYTALAKFYQGNVSMNEQVSIPTCIPSATDTCAGFKTLQVTVSNCAYKADSGVAVTSISDSFIYPSYFEMNGVVTK